MSQENVEVVRKMTEVWNQGGWQAVVDKGILHPEVEYHDDRKWPEARSTFGTAALVERFEDFMEVLGKDAEVDVERLVDPGGDRVVMIFRFTGKARASGIPHDYRWGFVCRVCHGQIDYIQAYLEPELALEAAGLKE
jgi:ketosteroid isomerase-like protein